MSKPPALSFDLDFMDGECAEWNENILRFLFFEVARKINRKLKDDVTNDQKRP